MTRNFSHQCQAQWQDMDANQHMSNSAYLQYATNTRFRFLQTVGFTPGLFAERQLGPVVLEDRLTYRASRCCRRSPSTTRRQLQRATDAGSRCGTPFSTDGQGVHAVVDSIGLWLDLDTRRPVVPPLTCRPPPRSWPDPTTTSTGDTPPS